jgi:putative colanic acid biosynthesis UDP-glucose lipid carrier transferase
MRSHFRPIVSLRDVLHPLVDSVCIILALWIVRYCAYRYFSNEAALVGCTAAIVFLILGQITGLYRRSRFAVPNSEVLSIVCTWTLTALCLSGLSVLTRFGEQFARLTIVSWMVLAPALVAFVRMCLRIVCNIAFQRGVGRRRVAIAGCNPLGMEVARGMVGEAEISGWQLMGFYDDRDKERLEEHADSESFSVKGPLSDLIASAKNREVDLVLVTLPMRAEGRIRRLLEELSDTTASVYIVPDLFVFELMHSRWCHVAGLPAVSLHETPFYGVDGIFKRTVDVVVASLAILIAAIPMAIIALLIKLTSKGPVLFGQRRYGLDGKEIRVWKFRSMRTCENGPVIKQATADDPRITPLGRILRKTSLDELPQLFNVLEGTMSLVGPRPHATAHNEQYRKLIRGYMLRHKVKPGITGLAQVEGCRGETDTLEKMQRRVEFDHRYIRNWSLSLDLRILLKTLLVAWRQPEAY